MTHSNANNNDAIAGDLASSLKVTTSLMKEVVAEIRDNATAVAVMREKINSLGDSVETLSHIVRDGNGKGSMITRMALAEKTIEDLEQSIDDFKEAIRDIKDCVIDEKKTESETLELKKRYRREKRIEKIKFWAAVLPGMVSAGALVLKSLGIF